MMMRSDRRLSKILALLLLLVLLGPGASAQEADYTFRSETEIVLVNVTVRDKSGNVVRDLKPEDFKVLEDGKTQHVVSFDLENTDSQPTADVAQVKPLASPRPPVGSTPPPAAVDCLVLRSFRDAT